MITGSSRGIGLQLARVFARRGHPLVVVAPDAAEISRVADGPAAEVFVDALPIAADLRAEGAIETPTRRWFFCVA